MLTPNEILAQMPAETAQQLFSYLFEKDKPLYKATIDSLAQQRKLRPVFIERKPRHERHTWMKEALGRKQNEGVAAHLLQIWLIGAHKQLLCDFLDTLGIAHDENGTIEELPPAPPKEALAAAVGKLLETHDPTVVAIYMHAFQALDNEGWSTLEELLHEDARLRLVAAEPAARA
jgi:hypothetical protein